MDEVAIDISRGGALVEVTLDGYFPPERAMRALHEVRRAIGALGDRAGNHVTLYTLSDEYIAPPETISLMQQAFIESLSMKIAARRVAYCAPSALQRMQLKRLREGRGDIEVFADREDAIAWLLSAN